MKSLVLCVALCVAAPCALADEIVDYRAKAEALDAQAVQSLGVSLAALRVLAGAKEEVYRPLAQLQQSGEFALIEELEAQGMVKIIRRDGLPNGYDRGNEYVGIGFRTPGRALQEALNAVSAR